MYKGYNPFTCFAKAAVVLPLVFYMGISTGVSQLISNKGQHIYIGPDAVMSVNGSILNEGIIENDGEIILAGDWENKQQYTAGQGALILTGYDQKIAHNGADIYSLVIDGGGEKQFLSSAFISGRLELIDGIIAPLTEANIQASPSASITGGSHRSYINGVFYQQGNGKKIFPIGKNGQYDPVTLEIYDGSPEVGMEVFHSNANPYFSLELREVSRNKLWQKTLLSGSLGEGALITLPMEVGNSEAVLEEVVIAAASSLEDTYKPLETLAQSGFINSGHITSELSSDMDKFTIGILAERPEERSIYIPNAFAPDSPKASVEDDRVKVYGREISSEDFLFRIYNRWGVMVYETTSYEEASTQGWDGTSKQTGRLEIMGSYKYILKGKFNSGRVIERSGSIHLIR